MIKEAHQDEAVTPRPGLLAAQVGGVAKRLLAGSVGGADQIILLHAVERLRELERDEVLRFTEHELRAIKLAMVFGGPSKPNPAFLTAREKLRVLLGESDD